jgi:hypothetical protein
VFVPHHYPCISSLHRMVVSCAVISLLQVIPRTHRHSNINRRVVLYGQQWWLVLKSQRENQQPPLMAVLRVHSCEGRPTTESVFGDPVQKPLLSPTVIQLEDSIFDEKK